MKLSFYYPHIYYCFLQKTTKTNEKQHHKPIYFSSVFHYDFRKLKKEDAKMWNDVWEIILGWIRK